MPKEQLVDYALRVGYMTLLDGNIAVNGENVPVFRDGAGISSQERYIFIQSTGNTDNSIKVGKDTISLTQLTIYCKGESVDQTDIEDIAAQVLAIIEPYNGFTVPVNEYFEVKEQAVVTDVQSPVLRQDTTSPAYERNIIIEHRITHLLKS